MKKFQKYIRRARELGMKDAVLIKPGDVVTAAWVRMKCRYGCGGYGRRLTCPPESPAPEETRAMLSEYRHAILLHIDETCDDGVEVTCAAVTLEKELFLDGYHKAFSMGAGPCDLCGKCPKGACRHPDRARPSMESCGIDVFATARKQGLRIHVCTDEDGPHDYYGLVLIE